MKRFASEVRDGGDAILDSIRPQVVDVAGKLGELCSIVDINWTPDQLVASGTSEQLSAWQQIPPLVARVDKFAALVAGFGRRGTFPLLDEPQFGVHNELTGLRDEALWLADGDPWQASGVINARRADWRSSPWVRLPLKLHSVDEARERLRALCESAFDAIEMSRGVRGRTTDDGWKQDPKRANPYSLPAEPAEASA